MSDLAVIVVCCAVLLLGVCIVIAPLLYRRWRLVFIAETLLAIAEGISQPRTKNPEPRTASSPNPEPRTKNKEPSSHETHETHEKGKP
jgi:hypothetical protein